MSRPIEQALTNLIPRHPGSLPPELLELASSLLAQSRSVVSNLRAEEEIGRTYACANLACERLKTALNLPPIEPRPPVPPQIYKKLYTHLDTLLSASSRRRPRSAQATPVKALPQKQTPSKEKSLEGFRSNRHPKRGLQFGSTKQKSLPRWVGPAIRMVCAEFNAGRAVPHVWAGVESVLLLPCPQDNADKLAQYNSKSPMDSEKEGKMSGLVATIVLFVVAALESKITSKQELFDDKKRMWRVLKGMRHDEEVQKRVGDAEGWNGWDMEDLTLKEWGVIIDDWLDVIAGKGWLGMEWRTNIVDGSGASGKAGEDSRQPIEDEIMGEPETASNKLRRTGLGTMMQAKFDYLSDEKREAYAVWKKAMLAKLDELDAESMDATEG